MRRVVVWAWVVCRVLLSRQEVDENVFALEAGSGLDTERLAHE